MKKVIIFSLAIAVVFAMSGITALADKPITTGLTKYISGGDNPIIKAKWEMNYDASRWGSIVDMDTGADEAYQWTSMTSDGINPGQDDYPGMTAGPDEGAQFDPSGVHASSTWIMICAIATDPLGVADINHVYATVYYPESIYLGDNHEWGRQGCGEPHGNQIQLVQLSKNDGIELFCNNIRGENYTLPTFNEVEVNPTTGAHFDYGEICGTEGHVEDGELWKETAYVYCKYKELSYEDPAGDYKVSVYADDGKGLESARLINYFEYVEMTAFETDFDSIQYGNVGLNVHKIISGDTVFDTGGATVRNIGNTRLNMIVWQDDMGFGQRDDGGGPIWNVEWDARVGSNVAYQNYFPNYVYDPESFGTGKVLDEALDLSETNEMDFSILVSKFEGEEGQIEWLGHMVLGAQSAPFRLCLENKKVGTWAIIPGDGIEGTMEYSSGETTFNGTVEGQGLVSNSKYQITLNSQPNTSCGFTATSLGEFGANAFESGFWDSASPNLATTCVGDDEGLYNMKLINDHYTFISDDSGNFTYAFDLNLPAGTYTDVKVLVKKMLNNHVSPWADTGTGYPAFNLYEIAPITFTVAP